MIRTTINKIDQELRNLCEAHLQINAYFYGFFLDVYESNNVKHSSVIAHVTDANIDDSYITMTINLMVCDKIDDGKSLEKYVDSTTLQIINDLIVVMTTSDRWKRLGTITNATSVQNFSQKGGSVVNGWFCNLNFRIKNAKSFCDLPIKNYIYD